MRLTKLCKRIWQRLKERSTRKYDTRFHWRVIRDHRDDIVTAYLTDEDFLGQPPRPPNVHDGMLTVYL